MTVVKLTVPGNLSDEFVKKVNEQLKGMEDMEIFHNGVVVAKFIRDKLSKNIIAASETQREDKWQGKIGMVVAIGPSAFVNEPGFDFHGLKINVGDWVMYRNTDGWDFDYLPDGMSSDKIHLRLLEDTHIKGRVKSPDRIW